MKKTLCFDFGNSRYKCGVMEAGFFKKEIILDGSSEEINHILEVEKPEKTILSSVVRHDEKIEEILAAGSSFHKVTYQSKMDISVPSGQEKTVGSDRWAMLAGAMNLFPKQHNLIIGLGSCITFNFINKFNQFLGGSISPGLNMRLKSLQHYTAQLPLVEPDWNFPLIGYDTRTNILSGVIGGMSKEIDGIVDEYKVKYNKFNVLLTGGDLPFFVPHIKNKIFADPYLIYKGLYFISEKNA
ncbi:type III pantothenate kinase [Arachidicoccus soli]|uniref:Type III pantothenate kinase n=1 Tax=Arachidicoccus soli TaxID=2341117 RepID=A0A386HSA8_9BACT|nr:type III pantothenate kinase [Arachidicoccus soli]AYD48529.1 type III pantothenate kinase [Arachidicoccus soli]